MAIPIILAAASVASSVVQANQQRKASGIQQRIADSKAVMERRNIVRQERIRRAQIINQSTQQGTAGSSSAKSAVGAIGSQAAIAQSQSFATQALSGQASNALQQAANLGTASSIFGTVSTQFDRFNK